MRIILSLLVFAAGLSAAAAVLTLQVHRGQAVSRSLEGTPLANWPTADILVNGQPNGCNVSFVPPACPVCPAMVAVASSLTLPPGNYPVTLHAPDGREAIINLSVDMPGP
jgi:hypothetical protein